MLLPAMPSSKCVRLPAAVFHPSVQTCTCEDGVAPACRESNGLHLIVEMLAREPVQEAAISAVLLIKVTYLPSSVSGRCS